MLRVLLTNDDGIQAEGLRALARRLAPRCEVLVVAPHEPSSATSHSITVHKPLRLKPWPQYTSECSSEGAPLEAYACTGTPSDSVMLALLHLYQERLPHLVISGINDGPNVAQDLSYSGTVGSALEGAVIGVPSIAVSSEGQRQLSFDDAAAVVDLILAHLLYGHAFSWHAPVAGLLPVGAGGNPDPEHWPGIAPPVDDASHYPVPGPWYPAELDVVPCFNVNLPDRPRRELKGVRWTHAGHREYTDVVRATVDPRGEPYYWIAGERVHEADAPGTDTHALTEGYVSVTPVSYDITHQATLRQMQRWLAERGAVPRSQKEEDDG